MAISGNIENIRKILNSNTPDSYNRLYFQWSKDIEESNSLISFIDQDEEYLEKNELKVFDTIERLNQELDYYSELGINLEGNSDIPYDFPEIRRNLEKNYRTLSLKWYKHNFDNNKKNSEKSEQALVNINQAQEELEKKLKNIDNRVEGLGATFLNIVLTVSITTTMVTVLLNTSPQYSLAIILGCAWLLLSSIIFISSYFKTNEKKENNILPFIIYIGLTVVTILAFGFGWFESNEQNHPKKAENVEIIENNDIINQDNSSQTPQ